ADRDRAGAERLDRRCVDDADTTGRAAAEVRTARTVDVDVAGSVHVAAGDADARSGARAAARDLTAAAADRHRAAVRLQQRGLELHAARATRSARHAAAADDVDGAGITQQRAAGDRAAGKRRETDAKGGAAAGRVTADACNLDRAATERLDDRSIGRAHADRTGR